jgi:hypothetical protein
MWRRRPLYIMVGAIPVLTHPGFDVRYNMLSQRLVWLPRDHRSVPRVCAPLRGVGQHVWAIYSADTGIFFLVSFLGTASGSGLVALTPALWVPIALAGYGSQPWRRI